MKVNSPLQIHITLNMGVPQKSFRGVQIMVVFKCAERTHDMTKGFTWACLVLRVPFLRLVYRELNRKTASLGGGFCCFGTTLTFTQSISYFSQGRNKTHSHKQKERKGPPRATSREITSNTSTRTSTEILHNSIVSPYKNRSRTHK